MRLGIEVREWAKYPASARCWPVFFKPDPLPVALSLQWGLDRGWDTGVEVMGLRGQGALRRVAFDPGPVQSTELWWAACWGGESTVCTPHIHACSEQLAVGLPETDGGNRWWEGWFRALLLRGWEMGRGLLVWVLGGSVWFHMPVTRHSGLRWSLEVRARVL